jgi:hypothetical protein
MQALLAAICPMLLYNSTPHSKNAQFCLVLELLFFLLCVINFSQMIISCEISSFHGSEYEAQNHLGCTAVCLIDSWP